MPDVPAGIVVVIALPEDSIFAPGRSMAIPLDTLLARAGATPAAAKPSCALAGCATLPGTAVVEGRYVVPPSVWLFPPPMGVGWNLGNTMATSLPIVATYRLLWPPGTTSAVDAETRGLPLPQVQVTSQTDFSGIPGPAGGPSSFFQTYLLPGTYQRILRPTAPFNQAFPPQLKVVTVVEGVMTTDSTPIDAFDLTRETGLGPTIPSFNISNANGTLDGWTAYLRNSANQTISSVVPLHSAKTTGVVLATDYVAATVDALTDAVLVVAPPLGSPVPTAIFRPVGKVLPADEVYPLLPPAATVRGLVSFGNVAVDADIVFEALSITGADGTSYTTNFEFVEWASARAATLPAGANYTVSLPPGRYRVTVSPVDRSSALRVISPFVVEAGAPIDGHDFALESLHSVRGTATVADGRPLAGANVEAIPAGCADGTSDWCLPRPALTSTSDAGSFELNLDPGQYVLRVRPAEGSRLPWVLQPLSVPAVYESVAVKVPAPLVAAVSLFEPTVGAAIVHAIVRVFLLPAHGSAVELGRTLTGNDGRFEMYLTLPSQ